MLAREEPFAGEEVCAALAEVGVEIRADTHVTAVARANGRVTRRARRRLERLRRRGPRGRRPAHPVGRPRRRRLRRRARAPDRGRRRRCASPATTGSTSSATPTAAPCSPTWASTRAASSPTASSAARSPCAATARSVPRVTFTDPQVAAVGHTLASAQEAGIDARAVDVPTGGNAGGTLRRPRRPRYRADRRRRAAPHHRRRDLHRAPRWPRRSTPRRSP